MQLRKVTEETGRVCQTKSWRVLLHEPTTNAESSPDVILLKYCDFPLPLCLCWQGGLCGGENDPCAIVAKGKLGMLLNAVMRDWDAINAAMNNVELAEMQRKASSDKMSDNVMKSLGKANTSADGTKGQ